MNNLGNNIKHLRKKQKLSQKKLGELIDASQTSVAHYELGTREPTIEKLVSLSKVFNENVDYLLGNNIYENETVKNSEKIENISSLLLESLLKKDDRLFISLFINNILGIYELSYIMDVIFRELLYSIGSLWNEGSISEADEHYASNQIRKVISYISILNMDNIKTKTAVTMSVDGERHTLGIEMVNTFLESLGVQSIFLGSNLPYRSIENIVKDVNPDYIFISITLSDYVNSLNQLIEFIISKTSESLKIVVGGQGLSGYKTPLEHKNVTYISSLKDIENYILSL